MSSTYENERDKATNKTYDRARRLGMESITSTDYPRHVLLAWMKANSIGHHVLQDMPFIVGHGWICAFTLPNRSDMFPEGQTQPLGPGTWVGERDADLWFARSKWRWYLMRTHPRDHMAVTTGSEDQ